MLRSEWTCWQDALADIQEAERACGPHPLRAVFRPHSEFDEWYAKATYSMELSYRKQRSH